MKKGISLLLVFSLLFTFLPLTVSASENPEYPNEGCWNLATVTENGYTLDIYDKGHSGVPNALAVTDADMLAAAQNGTVTVPAAFTVSYEGKNYELPVNEIKGWFSEQNNGSGSVHTIAFAEGSTVSAVSASALNSYSLQNIKTLDLSNTKIVTLSSKAFQYNTALQNVKLPVTLKKIGSRAFQGCSGLTGITIPSSVTEIGSYAFSGCALLTEITLPAGLTAISDNCFNSCGSLTSVAIPAEAESIGVGAFANCTALDEVLFAKNNALASIGNYAFNQCYTLASFDFAALETLENIGDFAFAYCYGLDGKVIDLPKSLTSIGRMAFSNINGTSGKGVTFWFRNRDLLLIPSGYDAAGAVSLRDYFNNTVVATVNAYETDSLGNISEIKAYLDEMCLNEYYHYTFEAITAPEPVTSYIVSGTVVPADAVVTVKTGETVSELAVDAAGYFSAVVPNSDMVLLTVAAEGYIARSFAGAAGREEAWELGTVTLDAAARREQYAVVFTVSDGREKTDFEGLSFTLTANGTPLTEGVDYQAVYPYITLLSASAKALADDAELQLTADVDERFGLTGGSACIARSGGIFELPLTAWGRVELSLTSAFAGGEQVLIFDENGALALSGSAMGETFISDALKAGSYTVAAFNKNRYITSFSSLQALKASGVEYASSSVTVIDGENTAASLTVPVLTAGVSQILDRDKCSVSLRKTQAYAGEAMRLTVHYAFAGKAAAGSLTVYLPEGTVPDNVCSETDKLLPGAGYTYADNKLVLPVNAGSGRFTVSFTANATGVHTISALLSDGSVTAPLGTVSYAVESVRVSAGTVFTDEQGAKFPLEIKAKPNTAVNVSVNGESFVVKTNAEGTYSAAGADSIKVPENIFSGRRFPVTASYAAGGNTYTAAASVLYMKNTNAPDLRFIYRNTEFTVMANGLVNQNLHYMYIASGARGENDTLSDVWTFTAEITGTADYDTGSVFVVLIMKDGTDVYIPLSLIGSKDAENGAKRYAFAASYELAATDGDPSLIPEGIFLQYPHEYAEEPANRALLQSEGSLAELAESMKEDLVPDYRLADDAKTAQNISELKTWFDYENYTAEQKAEADALLKEYAAVLTGDVAGERALFGTTGMAFGAEENIASLPAGTRELLWSLSGSVSESVNEMLTLCAGLAGLDKELYEYDSAAEAMEGAGLFAEAYEPAAFDLSGFDKVSEGLYRKEDGNVTVFVDTESKCVITRRAAAVSENAPQRKKAAPKNGDTPAAGESPVQYILRLAQEAGYGGKDIFEAQAKGYLNNALTDRFKATEKYLDDAISAIDARRTAAWNAYNASQMTAADGGMNALRASLEEQNALSRELQALKQAKSICNIVNKILPYIAMLVSFYDYGQLVQDIEKTEQNILQLDSDLDMYFRRMSDDPDALQKCVDACVREREILYELKNTLGLKRAYIYSDMEAALLAMVSTPLAAVPVYGQFAAGALGVSLLTFDLVTSGDKQYRDNHISRLNMLYEDARSWRYRLCGEQEKSEFNSEWYKKAMSLHPVIDPSGTVYEAVESNKLSGVTAQIWFADNSGGENARLWDAADYDQLNPQLTDNSGAYEWYVPDGWWQVRFTKEGYENAATPWLEVPPPRMELSTGMNVSTAPSVIGVNAYSDYIELIFDQYMDADVSLLSVPGFTPVWENIGKNNAGKAFSKVLRLVPEAPLSGTAGFTLTGAKNYAGTALGEYSRDDSAVQERPAQLVLNYTEVISAFVGEMPDPKVTVRVLDAEGKPMAGKTVNAALSNELLVSLTPSAVTDEQGIAAFTLRASLPGRTEVTFTVENTALETNIPIESTLNENRPARPTAMAGETELTSVSPRDNYVTVLSGSLLTLTAEEGAVIYYTTDGTCPCQNTASRKEYTAPVELTENAYYRIAAYKPGMDYSRRLNITVTVQPAVCRHEDASGCGICDLCGADLHELQKNCTHLCHKAQKNSIFRFVWKLLRVLYKVFKIEEKEFCACGVKH